MESPQIPIIIIDFIIFIIDFIIFLKNEYYSLLIIESTYVIDHKANVDRYWKEANHWVLIADGSSQES
jgi:hypothetical protein